MKTKRIWHAGPPPHIGWWQVSRFGQSCDMWRWWNGHEWSNPHARVQRRVAVRFGYVSNPEELLWNDYWPKNARVPRLDPTDGHWTFNTTGERPHTDARRIQVCLRDGWTPMADPTAKAWRWRRDGGPMDILAWRPAPKGY